MAKEQIKGNIGILFVITLIVALVSGLSNIVPVVGSLACVFVITPAFSIAIVIIYLKLAAGTKPEIAELFQHFNKFWGAFKVTFLTGLFTFLWALLLYIPGIIKALKNRAANGAIVLMHDIHAKCSIYTEEFLKNLESRGYLCVTVDELFCDAGVPLMPNVSYFSPYRIAE